MEYLSVILVIETSGENIKPKLRVNKTGADKLT